MIVENGKYFRLGFVFAIATTTSVGFAVEPIAGQDKFLEYVPTPVPPQGNVPTAARNTTVHGLISIAGCGAAALGIGACVLLVDYCAGKLSTHAIDRVLGFK